MEPRLPQLLWHAALRHRHEAHLTEPRIRSDSGPDSDGFGGGVGHVYCVSCLVWFCFCGILWLLFFPWLKGIPPNGPFPTSVRVNLPTSRTGKFFPSAESYGTWSRGPGIGWIRGGLGVWDFTWADCFLAGTYHRSFQVNGKPPLTSKPPMRGKLKLEWPGEFNASSWVPLCVDRFAL